ncbi:MAG: glycosyltransferase family 4 protein [Alphaproteobacteria bacterium]|nr:glycosyltransferase family 4 protein [Alphaproteobacteria bacterium]
MKILMLASFAPSLVNFRGRLIQDMVAAGHKVTAAAPGANHEVASALKGFGAGYVPISMSRSKTNPLEDALDLVKLWRLLRELRPDLLFAYTIKPVIYGGLAARFSGVPKTFVMVTGLGQVFADDQRLKRRLLRGFVTTLYRQSLAKIQGAIFQNEDDLRAFRERRIIGEHQLATRVHGSGVDLDHFGFCQAPTSPPVFLLVARLLRAKGIADYVAAARLLRERHPHAKFRLLGPIEPSASGIAETELRAWQEEGVIDYLGETSDVRPHLRACSAFVLPTYYPEGLPRSLIEAMAIGRAIITTDVPGARDTVIAGENGYLVPIKAPEALADAMARLIESPARIVEMGKASRRMAAERYDVATVNAAMLDAMGLTDKAVSSHSTAHVARSQDS